MPKHAALRRCSPHHTITAGRRVRKRRCLRRKEAKAQHAQHGEISFERVMGSCDRDVGGDCYALGRLEYSGAVLTDRTPSTAQRVSTTQQYVCEALSSAIDELLVGAVDRLYPCLRQGDERATAVRGTISMTSAQRADALLAGLSSRAPPRTWLVFHLAVGPLVVQVRIARGSKLDTPIITAQAAAAACLACIEAQATACNMGDFGQRFARHMPVPHPQWSPNGGDIARQARWHTLPRDGVAVTSHVDPFGWRQAAIAKARIIVESQNGNHGNIQPIDATIRGGCIRVNYTVANGKNNDNNDNGDDNDDDGAIVLVIDRPMLRDREAREALQVGMLSDALMRTRVFVPMASALVPLAVCVPLLADIDFAAALFTAETIALPCACPRPP